MLYNVFYVNYWLHCDNNCQFAWAIKAEYILNRFISYAYAINGLAQKLQYFCSPIKKLAGETK
jgi:hypothetical protein